MEITLIIPVRIDSNDRLENLTTIIDYYKHVCKIYVIESDKISKTPYFDGIEYEFIYDDSEHFHRTSIINHALSKIDTPYVSNYDCDVIIPYSQLDEALKLLEKYDVVYPYDGRFMDISRVYIPNIKNNDFNINGNVIHPQSVGGAIFFNTKVYRDGGGENTKFISWGAEDVERFYRFGKLGYKITRCSGLLYHINHHRGINSGYSNPYWGACQTEYEYVKNLDTANLKKYIKNSWFYDNP